MLVSLQGGANFHPANAQALPRTRWTASVIIFYEKYGCLALVTGHNTDLHYNSLRLMNQEKYDREVYEYHCIDHYPLLHDGKLQVSKKISGHIPFTDVTPIESSFILVNYKYNKLTNLMQFQSQAVLLKILDKLFVYRDQQAKKMDTLESKINTLSKKIKVCNFKLWLYILKHKINNRSHGTCFTFAKHHHKHRI